MIIVKLTAMLTLVIIFLLARFKLWVETNPVRAIVRDYPAWVYIMALFIWIDVIGIFASAIWFLFFYL